ncbi:uncharacterized protein BXZ73DRAFT_87239 [Epithele typhae]|uniref:uncharacterized protein n=1 Tax=Epithele typhae TaxID=378194 RepID=UPI002008C762|nr:uncharacterized protein BXZ73DRAFT_87239 [Epithele typhae]KAH9944321.1 hypothetical protein BXZ73DRAFT_87239 [Epithele typhae]
MAWLAKLALAVLHCLYHLVLVLKSLASKTRKSPKLLTAQRSNVPRHLALALVPNPLDDEETNEKYMLDSVEKVAEWCQVVGIPRLTVYDQNGILANASLDIRERLSPSAQDQSTSDSPTECDIQYPPTPPPSDGAESRPLSPRSLPIPKLGVTTIQVPHNSTPKRRSNITKLAVRRRRVSPGATEKGEPPLILHILWSKSSKAAMAAAATALLEELIDLKANGNTLVIPKSSIAQLTAVLEGDYGFPSPELTIVHQRPPVEQLCCPVELHGLPPWQMRLTEIYWEPYQTAVPRIPLRSAEARVSHIEEVEFRRALDEFASAEMRLGK